MTRVETVQSESSAPIVVWVLTDTKAEYELEEDLHGLVGIFATREAAETEADWRKDSYEALLDAGQATSARLVSVTPWAMRP